MGWNPVYDQHYISDEEVMSQFEGSEPLMLQRQPRINDHTHQGPRRNNIAKEINDKHFIYEG